jgi:hypothetical protein
MHCPPRTVCNVLAAFNDGIYYIGIGMGEKPVRLLDDIHGDVWTRNAKVKSFVKDQLVKGAFYHDKLKGAVNVSVRGV